MSFKTAGMSFKTGAVNVHIDAMNFKTAGMNVKTGAVNVHIGAINVVPTVPVIPAKMTTNPTKTGKTEQMNRKRVSRVQSAIRAAMVTERLFRPITPAALMKMYK